MPEVLNVNELLEAAGYTTEVGEVKGKALYKHSAGEYTVIFGKLRVKYTNTDGKYVEEKPSPDAKPTHCVHDLLILSDASGVCYNADWSVDPSIPYGRLIFNQYISLKDNDQWRLKPLYQSFFFPENPEYSLVEGDKEFKIRYKFFPLYLGCKCKMKIEVSKKGKMTPYVAELELSDKTVNKDILAKRKLLVDKMYELTQKQWDLQHPKKESATPAVEDVPEPDDPTALIGDYSVE